jgi:asparagine synthase (glutamine-hydrolysing)
MANFIVIVDSKIERRKRFVRHVKGKISPLADLINGSCDAGNFSAMWAINQHAPISSKSDATNGASILLGDAFYNDERKKIDATSLRSLWLPPPKQAFPVLEGFFVGVVYHPLKGLVVGEILLGIFPIYYYINRHVIMVGSSPEIFKHHPCFTKEFNPRGLVGILLTSHIIGGETLFKGVRRLEVGHMLVSPKDEEPSEVMYYQPPISKRFFSLPFSTHVELLDEAISDSLDSQVNHNELYTLLLSGGLDSRMLAGYLKQQHIQFQSLTLGIKAIRR